MKGTLDITPSRTLDSVIKDYGQLLKVRLTITVVLSSVFGYLLAIKGGVIWVDLLMLVVGGFLVVASANGINQIIEKEYDKLMVRTQNRPVAQGRISVVEATVFCVVTGLSGVILLGSFLNETSAWLGLISLISYGFIYTPLKRVSPIAVFVGAIPGAIPPMLGWVAVTGSIGPEALCLFLIQFIWQFPHFWSIAWILDDDYKRAGFRMMPMGGGKSKPAARLNIWYSLLLIPIGFLPYALGISGLFSALIAVIAASFLAHQSSVLYRTLATKDAKRLMFYSIIYNPIVFLAFTLDKI